MISPQLRQMRRFGPLYSLALACGFTAVGRRLREQASRLGYRLRFRPTAIAVCLGQREIWFPPHEAAQVWGFMPRLEYLKSRFVFHRAGNREVADLREAAQHYRAPGGEERLWMPTMPEMADFFSGYLAEGGPRPGDLAFDCGAYCGEMTFALARMVGPTGRVFSFEPDARTRERLERNIAEAGLKNVTVVPKGLWKESTRLAFSADGDLASHLVESGATGRMEYVDTMSFAEACALAGGAPAFVKMDIEGAEVEAISGSLDFIARHSIRFAIASYHVRGDQQTAPLLEPMFRQIGYACKTGFPDHLTTWAWRA